MFNCLTYIRCKTCLESLDWVPVVSTATNMIHLFAKYGCKIAPGTSYGNYLHARHITEELGLLVPFYNIFVKARQYQGYRVLTTSEIELTEIAYVQNRRVCPMRRDETLITIGDEDVRYHTISPPSTFIEDKDIISILPYTIENDLGARFTRHQKAILQQNALHSATATCIDMLCLDKGKAVSFIASEDFSHTHQIARKLESKGLSAKISKIPQAIKMQPALFMETLKHYIFLKGSFIIGVESDTIGPHAIIIDEVSECLKYIRLRDPYHGWEITIKRKAILKSLTNKIIQIDS